MKFMRLCSFAVLACLLTCLVLPISFATNAKNKSVYILTYDIGARAWIPSPSCSGKLRPFLDVNTGNPSARWPTQVIIKGNGPWLVTLRATNGMLDMSANARANVYCVPRDRR